MYIVPDSAPRTTVAGRTYAIAAMTYSTSFETQVKFSVFELKGGVWLPVFDYKVGSRFGSGNTLDIINAAGGLHSFVVDFIDAVNAWFTLNGIVASLSYPSTGARPISSDQDALNEAQSALASCVFNKGIIPAQMRADYDGGYWTDAVPVGDSIDYANGTLTKCGKKLAIYADPEGFALYLSPVSDLNAIAKASKYIAKFWFDTYGFVPQ